MGALGIASLTALLLVLADGAPRPAPDDDYAPDGSGSLAHEKMHMTEGLMMSDHAALGMLNTAHMDAPAGPMQTVHAMDMSMMAMTPHGMPYDDPETIPGMIHDMGMSGGMYAPAEGGYAAQCGLYGGLPLLDSPLGAGAGPAPAETNVSGLLGAGFDFSLVGCLESQAAYDPQSKYTIYSATNGSAGGVVVVWATDGITFDITVGNASARSAACVGPPEVPVAPADCVCQAAWTSPSDGGDCGQTQSGCTDDCSLGGYGYWCMVENPGCAQEEHSQGGGWAYCDPAAQTVATPTPTPTIPIVGPVAAIFSCETQMSAAAGGIMSMHMAMSMKKSHDDTVVAPPSHWSDGLLSCAVSVYADGFLCDELTLENIEPPSSIATQQTVGTGTDVVLQRVAGYPYTISSSDVACLAENQCLPSRCPAPESSTALEGPADCVCQAAWTSPSDGGDCGQTQSGCTDDCSLGGYGYWCMVENPGCAQEEHSQGGGWAYCDPATQAALASTPTPTPVMDDTLLDEPLLRAGSGCGGLVEPVEAPCAEAITLASCVPPLPSSGCVELFQNGFGGESCLRWSVCTDGSVANFGLDLGRFGSDGQYTGMTSLSASTNGTGVVLAPGRSISVRARYHTPLRCPCTVDTMAFRFYPTRCTSSTGNSQGGLFDCQDFTGTLNSGSLTVSVNGLPGVPVEIGEVLTIGAPGSPPPSQSTLMVYDGSTLMQKVSVHTSCAVPIYVGDVFGSFEVLEFGECSVSDCVGGPMTCGESMMGMSMMGMSVMGEDDDLAGAEQVTVDFFVDGEMVGQSQRVPLNSNDPTTTLATCPDDPAAAVSSVVMWSQWLDNVQMRDVVNVLDTSPSATPSNSPTASETSSQTRSPSRTPSNTPSTSPSPSSSSSSSSSPSTSPSSSRSPSRSPSGTATPSNSESSSPTSSPSKTPSMSSSRSPSASKSPSMSGTSSPSRTASMSATSSLSPTQSPSKTPSMTGTSSVTPSGSSSRTPSASPTKSPSKTPSTTGTSSVTPSVTRSPSRTPSMSATSSVSPSLGATVSNTPSRSPSVSPSLSRSPSVTATTTSSTTSSMTPTSSPSASTTPSPSKSPSSTQSPSATPSASATPSQTKSPSRTSSISPTPGESRTPTRSSSPSASVTPSVTASVTPSVTASITPSVTPSVTPSSTPSSSKTPTLSPSGSPAGTPSVTSSPSGSPSVTPTPSGSTTPSPTASTSPAVVTQNWIADIDFVLGADPSSSSSTHGACTHITTVAPRFRLCPDDFDRETNPTACDGEQWYRLPASSMFMRNKNTLETSLTRKGTCPAQGPPCLDFEPKYKMTPKFAVTSRVKTADPNMNPQYYPAELAPSCLILDQVVRNSNTGSDAVTATPVNSDGSPQGTCELSDAPSNTERNDLLVQYMHTLKFDFANDNTRDHILPSGIVGTLQGETALTEDVTPLCDGDEVFQIGITSTKYQTYNYDHSGTLCPPGENDSPDDPNRCPNRVRDLYHYLVIHLTDVWQPNDAILSRATNPQELCFDTKQFESVTGRVAGPTTSGDRYNGALGADINVQCIDAAETTTGGRKRWSTSPSMSNFNEAYLNSEYQFVEGTDLILTEAGEIKTGICPRCVGEELIDDNDPRAIELGITSSSPMSCLAQPISATAVCRLCDGGSLGIPLGQSDSAYSPARNLQVETSSVVINNFGGVCGFAPQLATQAVCNDAQGMGGSPASSMSCPAFYTYPPQQPGYYTDAMATYTSPVSTVIKTETAPDTTVLTSDAGDTTLKDRRLQVSSWIARKSWWKPTGQSLYVDIPMTSAVDCTSTNLDSPPLINTCPDDYSLYGRQFPQGQFTAQHPIDWLPTIGSAAAYPPRMVSANTYPNLMGFDTISFVIDCNQVSTLHYDTPLLMSWPMGNWPPTQAGPCYRDPADNIDYCVEGGERALLSDASSYISRSGDSFPTGCALGENGDQCERFVFVNCPAL